MLFFYFTFSLIDSHFTSHLQPSSRQIVASKKFGIFFFFFPVPFGRVSDLV